MDTDTIFHKIVRGDVPCHKIYEDEKTLAFLDIYPRTEGHTLVIPKQNPAEFVWDLDDDTYQAVMETAKKVALHLRATSSHQYVHEGIVGTDVPYAHVHLIPFTSKTDLARPASDEEPDHEIFASIAAKLRMT